MYVICSAWLDSHISDAFPVAGDRRYLRELSLNSEYDDPAIESFLCDCDEFFLRLSKGGHFLENRIFGRIDLFSHEDFHDAHKDKVYGLCTELLVKSKVSSDIYEASVEMEVTCGKYYDCNKFITWRELRYTSIIFYSLRKEVVVEDGEFCVIFYKDECLISNFLQDRKLNVTSNFKKNDTVIVAQTLGGGRTFADGHFICHVHFALIFKNGRIVGHSKRLLFSSRRVLTHSHSSLDKIRTFMIRKTTLILGTVENI